MDSLSKIQQNLDFNSIKTEQVRLKEFTNSGVRADVLRLDKIHPVISGNKWFKIKYYLAEAVQKQATTILTFGGSWSNHIVATAWACNEAGLPSIGMIRGEEPMFYSHTLRSAADLGMKLIFISREQYQLMTENRESLSPDFEGTHGIPKNTYLIPAGGAGRPGLRGASEILQLTDSESYTHIACSIGTSTMFTGLVLESKSHQTVIGIPALKGFSNIPAAMNEILKSRQVHASWRLLGNYHFGGYARKTPELIQFMNYLYETTGIKTDFVYTGKLFFACASLATEKFFAPGSNLLIIHSGGLQGNNSLPRDFLKF